MKQTRLETPFIHSKFMNPYKYIVDIVVFFSVLFSFLYSIYNYDHVGYIFLGLLPLTYGFVYFVVYRRRIFQELKIFLTVFAGATFIRFVVMPVLIVYSGFYGGRSIVSPTDDSFKKACLLMIYELVVVALFIEFLERRRNRVQTNRLTFNMEVAKPKNMVIYFIFFGVTLLFGMLFPQSFRLFSFITPNLSGSEYLASPPFLEAIVIYMMFTSKHLIFVILLLFFHKHYEKSNKGIYKNLGFLIVILNICLFYGLNRSDLVMPAIASLLLYALLFRDRNISKYIIIAVIVYILISVIAESRELASISKDQNQWIDRADFIQGYFGGVYNVAISIETVDYFPEARNILRALYDTFRPFIGFNVLLKGVDMEATNAFFNRRIWFGTLYSQITPMVGQGFIHFGFILAPILDLFVIYIAYILEIWLYKKRRVEIIYFFSICLIRMGFLMGQNTGNMSNEISMNLVMFSVIYFVNNRIHLTEKRE
ncbi:MAG: oligosaccharide repeat unit polymerase [Anaerocolumna sp.]|nr:oligosaccharide repeat unit polymerase [Anaerocolumna sp.]